MSFGRSSGSTVQQSTSEMDPQIRAAFLSNLQRSQNVASGIGARQFAGFTPDQQQSFNITRQFSDPNSMGMQQARMGAGLVGSAGMYQPQQVAGQRINAAMFSGANIDPMERIQGQNVAAQTFGGAMIDPAAQSAAAQADRSGIRDVNATFGAQNLSMYQNPFEQQVVQTTLDDIERSRQMQQMQGSAQAQRAGAFGGSRQGVTEALTNEAALREAARTSAQLRSEGFQFSAGMGQQDAARALQSQMANQGVDMSLQEANAQLRQQTSLANQSAINQRAMEQAGLSQQAGLSSMQAVNAAQQRQAELAQQADATNQQLAFQRASEQAGLSQQAGLSNQAAFNAAQQRQAELAQQAALANQQAGLQGAQQRIQAGSQLADIGQMTQNLGFTQAQQLGQAGAIQQGFTQAQLDAIRNLPLEQQALINEALGLNPAGGSGMTSQSSGSGRQSGFNLGFM
jgi:hypothetical protein